MPDLFEQEAATDFSLPGDERLNEMIRSADAEAAGDYQPADEADAAAGETEPAGRPRDEQGRFVSQQPAETAGEDGGEDAGGDDAGEATVGEDGAGEPEEDHPYAGRYKTLADAARANFEKEQMIGRMSSELGELRAILQQMQQARQAPAAPAAPYLTQDALEDALADNPIVVADQALRSGDPQFIERVVSAWRDSDPTSAQLWVETRQAQRAAYEAAQRAEQAVSAAGQRASQDAVAQAWTQLQQEIPDLDQHRGAITAEAQRIADATGRNLVTEMMDSGDPAQIRDAIETLYYRARGRGSDTLAEAARSAAREHVAESQRAKAEAVVASASATGEAPPKSVADRIADSWAEIEAPMRDGWNIS